MASKHIKLIQGLWKDPCLSRALRKNKYKKKWSDLDKIKLGQLVSRPLMWYMTILRNSQITLFMKCQSTKNMQLMLAEVRCNKFVLSLIDHLCKHEMRDFAQTS